MSYDTEEQQLEKLKEWWSENGTPLVIGAILGLAGFGGWKYWNAQQVAYQEGASDMYLKVSEIVASEKKEGLVESAEAIKSQYPDSSYAILAAFHIAKSAVDKNDYDQAVTQLQWVISNHKDNELAPVAKIRLARIYIQQNKAEEALGLVEVDAESGYHALANLIKGDALLALDRKEEALEAYTIASNDLEVVARHPSLQIKIQSLTATPEVAETTEVEGATEEAEGAATEEQEPVQEESK